MAFPCDRFMERFDAAYYRGIAIEARPEVVFRWLCQLKVAPYSYDWIDNLGRRSPQSLMPGVDELAIGQTIMTNFELVEFERNRHLTIRSRVNTSVPRIFGATVSYLIVPRTTDTSRLLVKLIVRHPTGVVGWLMRRLLPWGDMIMMRRQLLNFKSLAERTPNGLQTRSR